MILTTATELRSNEDGTASAAMAACELRTKLRLCSHDRKESLEMVRTPISLLLGVVRLVAFRFFLAS